MRGNDINLSTDVNIDMEDISFVLSMDPVLYHNITYILPIYIFMGQER